MINSVFPPDPPDRPPPPDDQIRIVYEGQGESINVRELGKALTGLGVLVSAGGAEAKMTEARKDNSFALNIGLVQGELFEPEVLTSVTDFLFGPEGLISSIRQIRGRKVVRIEPGRDLVVLVFEDEETLELPKRVVDSLYDQAVTKSIRDLCSPLDLDEGVSGVSIHSSVGQHSMSLEKMRSYMAFSLPSTEYRRQQEFDAEITSTNFASSSNWQLRVAGMPRPIRVSIDDVGFMHRVDEGERFAKGDRIRGVVEVIQSDKKTEYRIIEAQHVALRQGELEL